MSTISTTLELQDKMTAQLNDIVQSLGGLLDTTKEVDSVISKLDGTIGDMLKSTTSLSSSGTPLDGWSDTAREVDGELRGVKKTTEDINNTTGNGSGNTFAGWGAGVVVLNSSLMLTQQLMTAIVQLAQVPIQIYQDNLRASNQIQAVLRRQVDTIEELNRNYSEMLQLSQSIEQSTGLAGGNLIDATAVMGRYIQDVDALAISMQTVADFSVGMTGNIEDAQRKMGYYAQILGRAMDGNTRYLERQGLTITDAQREIIKYGTEVERALIISDVVNQSWYGFAELMGNTAEGTIAIWNRNLENAQSLVGEFFMEIHATFLQFLASFGVNLEEVVIWAVQLIQNNIELIIVSLIMLGSVAVAVAVKFAIKWAIVLLPLIKVIAVLGTIIGVLKMVGITTEDVIVGMVTAWNFFYATIYNIISVVWNGFAWMLEQMVNGSIQSVNSMSRVFFNFFSSLLSMIGSVTGAIGGLFGQDWGLGGAQAQLDAFGNRMQIGYTLELERMQYKDILGETKAGLERGKDYADNFNQAIANIQGFEFGNMLDYSGMLGGMPSGYDLSNFNLNDFATSSGSRGSGKALKVYQTEPLEIREDNLRFLTDLAKFNITAQYQTRVTPNVQITINEANSQDVDGIAGAIGQMLEEYNNADLTRI